MPGKSLTFPFPYSSLHRLMLNVALINYNLSNSLKRHTWHSTLPAWSASTKAIAKWRHSLSGSHDQYKQTKKLHNMTSTIASSLLTRACLALHMHVKVPKQILNQTSYHFSHFSLVPSAHTTCSCITTMDG